jgi:hypothetical protein
LINTGTDSVTNPGAKLQTLNFKGAIVAALAEY